jgi:hypothetical protein
VVIFRRIAVLGGSSPVIDLHDADAILQYDPQVRSWASPGARAHTHSHTHTLCPNGYMVWTCWDAGGHVGLPKPQRGASPLVWDVQRQPAAGQQDAHPSLLGSLPYEHAWGSEQALRSSREHAKQGGPYLSLRLVPPPHPQPVPRVPCSRQDAAFWPRWRPLRKSLAL